MSAHQVTRPPIIWGSEWGSTPEHISDERRHTPRFVTIHHAGVVWEEGTDPFEKCVNLQAWGQRDKDWPDIPYHFLISPDGRIFQGRDLAYEGETNTEYDTNGHALIQVWGSFGSQRVREQQLRSAAMLAAWICQEYDISPETISGHKDHSSQTSCPGEDLYRYIESKEFQHWVEALLGGEEAEIAVGDPLPDGPTEFIPMH